MVSQYQEKNRKGGPTSSDDSVPTLIVPKIKRGPFVSLKNIPRNVISGIR